MKATWLVPIDTCVLQYVLAHHLGFIKKFLSLLRLV